MDNLPTFYAILIDICFGVMRFKVQIRSGAFLATDMKAKNLVCAAGDRNDFIWRESILESRMSDIGLSK